MIIKHSPIRRPVANPYSTFLAQFGLEVNECHSPKPTAAAADIVSVLVEDSDEHDLYREPA
jgi:hypothetical protein